MLSRKSENRDGKEDSFEKEYVTVIRFIEEGGCPNGTLRIKVAVRNGWS